MYKITAPIPFSRLAKNLNFCDKYLELRNQNKYNLYAKGPFGYQNVPHTCVEWELWRIE